jgi:hypothetical protein
LTPANAQGDGRDPVHARTHQVETFKRRMLQLESRRAPVVWLAGSRRWPYLSELPFASISVLVILLSLFAFSLHLGGWTWSSWIYALSMGLVPPLAAIELKRKAVITGGAVILLVFTVVIDAGLPQYFGYSASHLSWYDLAAHYLGAMLMTLFLWSFICWTVSPSGPPRENGRRKLLLTVAAMLTASFVFEFAEFATDALFGWGNFHPGVDTAGDLFFDVAGVVTAAVVISRHRVSALRRPFWHGERVGA